MSKKRIIAVGAMMAVLHSAPAFAEEDLNACRKITDPAKRLECYDSLSNVPAETSEARVERQTENFGLTERQKAPENRKEVGEITGRIAALAGSQLTLDNGMVWKITDGGRLRDWLQVGQLATISQGLLSGYRLQVQEAKGIAVVKRVQ